METTKIVEQIHHEIKTSYLKKMGEIEFKENQFHYDENKAKLAKLGFGTFLEYGKKHEEIKKDLEYKEFLKQLKIDYPYQKFVSYQDLAKIIMKYQLVIKTQDHFIGTIPEKNIKQIADFKLKENYFVSCKDKIRGVFNDLETRAALRYLTIFSRPDHFLFDISFDEQKKAEILHTYKKQLQSEILKRYQAFHSRQISSYEKFVFIGDFAFSLQLDSRMTEMDVLSDFTLSRIEILPLKNAEQYYIFNDQCNNEIIDYNAENQIKDLNNTEVFWVAGTPDQFAGYKEGEHFVHKGNFYPMKQRTSFLKDDPIVLKPMRYGCLVVTAWGDEAQIPGIKDETQN